MSRKDVQARLPLAFEKLLLAIAIVMLALYAGSRLYTAAASHVAVLRFRSSTVGSRAGTSRAQSQVHEAKKQVDFSLWSGKRMIAYSHMLAMTLDPALAILAIPKLRLEVPVFDGTNELILNRGAGRIKGTARPGEPGNIGIAAHRDGFFRGLKYIQVGDRIELRTSNKTDAYVVDDIVIVRPNEVQVLRPRSRPSLTLVTCYPFYFVGDAPQRYIVHAYRADEQDKADRPNLKQKKDMKGQTTKGETYEYRSEACSKTQSVRDRSLHGLRLEHDGASSNRDVR